MPSPFPGMDPYLEAHWRDIHASLVVYASDSLQGVLPGRLRARVDERVLLQPPYLHRPQLKRGRKAGSGKARSAGGLALAEPLLVDVEPESATETFLQIIDPASGNRVVTVIEFLSPSNKIPGPNREQYRRKQQELCSSDANLVEIDLNRFGIHTLAVPLSHLGPRARTPYMTCVRRATLPGKAEVYPMPLWEPLPAVKIPLRPEDTDVTLELQPLIDDCYRKGGYEGTLDYAVDPDPPLLGADRALANQWLRDKGLRQRKQPSRKAKGSSRKK